VVLLTLFDPQRQLILRAHGPEVGPPFYVIKLKFQYCEWPGPLAGRRVVMPRTKDQGDTNPDPHPQEQNPAEDQPAVDVVAFCETRLIYKPWPKILQN